MSKIYERFFCKGEASARNGADGVEAYSQASIRACAKHLRKSALSKIYERFFCKGEASARNGADGVENYS